MKERFYFENVFSSLTARVISYLIFNEGLNKALWVCARPANMPLNKTTTVASVILILFFLCEMTSARELYQVPGVIHVHSTYSSGSYSIEELVSKADDKGIEVLVLTDHDLVVMEYGLFPFRNLIKKREERNSVLQTGPEQYLAEIERLNKQQDSVLIIPGVQSSPFYYWSGNPLRGGLTAHDYRKELLVVGLFRSEDYYNIPNLHGGFSTRYVKDHLASFALFFAAFCFSFYLIFQIGRLKIVGIVMAALSIALMVDDHPFKSSRFDPYHGNRGIAPFQELINYVRSRGGLIFWAHPESNYSKNGTQMGPAKLMTKHYPDDLIESKNYTGFSAIYGDSASATKAGMHWDQILIEYCKGRRDQPVWGIAGSDFHVEKKGVDLDTFQTIFLVKDKSRKEVLHALGRGRFYAVRNSKEIRLSLDEFIVKDKATGNTAIMGEELNSNGLPIVEGQLSATDRGRYNVTVSIVRGGELVLSFEGETPLDFHFVDHDQWRESSFYRLDVRDKAGGQLLSNPIFVTRDNG